MLTDEKLWTLARKLGFDEGDKVDATGGSVIRAALRIRHGLEVEIVDYEGMVHVTIARYCHDDDFCAMYDAVVAKVPYKDGDVWAGADAELEATLEAASMAMAEGWLDNAEADHAD